VKRGDDGVVVASNSCFGVIQWISNELHLDGWEVL
jgi:hypothetical protein